MKKTGILITLLIAAVFVVSCSKTDMPKTEPANVWNYLQDQNYTDWQLFPGTTELYPGESPHGAFLTSYINKKAAKSVNNDEFAYGSIIVKENYTPSKKLAAVTVMYKVKGFNPDGGDWYWAKYSPKGDAQAVGKVKGCIQCHSAVKDSDWSYLKSEM
ncbi:cytochrome P460 family protein [Flexistipes sinusarabici]|uniref:cytochrome P460 family protein n=1 Tax=Flexistipes sinusarabici TaxID=2352 RepID=UPI00235242BF|nr:cytochrome P460 family protein [Flexistipes sinusarabici]